LAKHGARMNGVFKPTCPTRAARMKAPEHRKLPQQASTERGFCQPPSDGTFG
jgi:hypothetical protein